MIRRYLQHTIEKYLDHNKGIIIYGARQVGKTTLVNEISRKYQKPMYLSCDDPVTSEMLSDITIEALRRLVVGHDCLIIDEAQKVRNIGNAGKMIIDNQLVKQLIMTGSSSLDLANTVKEPMTGRIFEFNLMPISYQEIIASDTPANLESLLIFGSYPEVITSSTLVAKKIISQIAEQYTFKDINDIADVRDPNMIRRLLIALAQQVGSEVSYNELANLLEINRLTVERYIWLLEKAFIIYRLDALTGNPRKLVSLRKRKIYFTDLGIRNALINNFNNLEIRTDNGQLFENFCINERRKMFANVDKKLVSYYFRSSKTKTELDYVEDFGGSKKAYEFKWKSSKYNIPNEFTKKYPDAPFSLINNSNYKSFVSNL